MEGAGTFYFKGFVTSRVGTAIRINRHYSISPSINGNIP
jgi:hypothetical protein